MRRLAAAYALGKENMLAEIRLKRSLRVQLVGKKLYPPLFAAGLNFHVCIAYKEGLLFRAWTDVPGRTSAHAFFCWV